jgi:hypothetical protein
MKPMKAISLMSAVSMEIMREGGWMRKGIFTALAIRIEERRSHDLRL